MIRKIIFDEAALRLAASKLPGQPIYFGPDGGLLSARVVDLVEDEDVVGKWQPGDERTQLAALAAEACRDFIFHSDSVIRADTRKRGLKAATVTACSMMDVMAKLLASLDSEETRRVRAERWSQEDLNTYLSVGRRFRKSRNNNRVRRVRNRVGAHFDTLAFSEEVKADAEEIFRSFGDCIVLFVLTMNHLSRNFSWIRFHDSAGDHDLVDTMFEFPACVRWVVDASGVVEDLHSIRLAENPLKELQRSALSAADCYNLVVQALDLNLLPIWCRSSSRSDDDVV